MSAIFRVDLDEVLERTKALWRDLAGARIFITGGTGFIGKWLVETFLHANREHDLRAQAVVLSRQPENFAVAQPHLVRDPALLLVRGDVRNFELPAGDYSHAVHAAADVTQITSALNAFDSAVIGTRRVLDFCCERGVGDLLLLSSGAVYGRQPADIERVTEIYAGAPAPTEPNSAYAQGKRAAEWLAATYCAEGGPAVRIARGFALVGPHLPTDRHFAIGNFIRDAIGGNAIRIGGDGTPLRSYLYAADMAAWLWTLLLRGRPGQAYNVGSDEAISIATLARTVAQQVAPGLTVTVAHKPLQSTPLERYVPDISKARAELGLEVWTPLADAITRTARWLRQDASAGAARMALR